MAVMSRRIGRWLCMAVLISTALASVGKSLADDPPKGQAKPMFRAPEGWMMTRRSDDVVFYDAPGRKDREVCRIGVIAPMEVKSGFEEWFQLVQAPDPVVSETRVTEGKSKGGYETLRQTRVVEQSRGNLHRHYCGMRVGKSYVLILYSASSEELFKKNLEEVQELVDSWDASGTFPRGSDQERKKD
jgi:hypothetical protein